MTELARTRKFRPMGDFKAENAPYYLLPFRFHVVDEAREILVNEVGDYLWAPRGTAQRIAEHQLSPSDPLYPDLLASAFLSQQPLPDLIDLYATRYRTKKSFLDGFTSLHIFVPTLRCNQSCHYCQVSRQTTDKTEYDMSPAHMDLAMEHMFRSPSPQLTMEFQGGEPLLAFELVRYAILRASALNLQHQKSLTFVICTNILLIDDEILAFCKEHAVLISTSIDGPDLVHDDNRPFGSEGSARRVREQLDKVRAVLGEDRVSALMTTTKLSLNYPKEIVDTYVAAGFDGIFLRPISPYGFARKSKSKNLYETRQFLDFYYKALSHILERNKQGHLFREDYATILLRKILTPFPVGYVDLQSPAGMITSVIVFNFDGGVYASDEARMLAEQGDDYFKLGQVSDSYETLFYGAKARELLDSGVNEALAGCSDCAFQAYCGADPVFHYATQGDPVGYRPTSSFCQRNMSMITYLLEIMERDPEVAQIFRRWVAR